MHYLTNMTEQDWDITKLGYNKTDVDFLKTYGVTVEEMLRMTPQEVSDMADLFAELNSKLLGC